MDSILPRLTKDIYMSFGVQVFIDGNASLNGIAAEIETFIGTKLHKVDGPPATKYSMSSQDYHLDLLADHGFENDRDMDFESYRYVLDLSEAKGSKPSESRRQTEKLAKALFGRLKESNQYRLMLVEDGQRRIESFDPDQPTAYR